MGQPAAKQGDQIFASDMHTVLIPVGAALVPVTLPHSFVGIIDGALSSNVTIMGMPAATVDSSATNAPHFPAPSSTGFQKPPANKGTISVGSGTVFINGKAAARHADAAETCNDPGDRPAGRVTAVASVLIG